MKVFLLSGYHIVLNDVVLLLKSPFYVLKFLTKYSSNFFRLRKILTLCQMFFKPCFEQVYYSYPVVLNVTKSDNLKLMVTCETVVTYVSLFFPCR